MRGGWKKRGDSGFRPFEDLMFPYFQGNGITIYNGKCEDVLPLLPAVDFVCTDPPYALKFMGKAWDYQIPQKETWEKILAVLKPGGHLFSFGGTRTYHRLVCAIEDAGFEIRDCIMWVYGSGFPKSLDVSKAIDKELGAEREVVGRKIRGDVERAKTSGSTFATAEANKNNKAIFGYGVEDITIPSTDQAQKWQGWGTALKPAYEPIVIARKPLEGIVAENVLKYGTGAINIDGCRVETEDRINSVEGGIKRRNKINQEQGYRPYVKGFNNQDKEVWEQNKRGRFPANLIHDGSEEVLELFPKSGNGNGGKPYSYAGREYNNRETSMFNGDKPQAPSNFNDSGSAARFFYCSKASKAERNAGLDELQGQKRDESRNAGQPSMNGGDGNPSIERVAVVKNSHPCVKPLKLMQYLIKLGCHKDGVVLDPFCGSGSTLLAARKLGMRAIGIEVEEKYCEIASKRVQALAIKPDAEKQEQSRELFEIADGT